jgi:hypothetical protein
MGSFATSLHVKSSDADRVAATLTEILAGSGWRPTQKDPESEPQWGAPPTLRGLQVSAPRDGWVSVLDTDLMGAHGLAPAIAEKLDTHAIFFLVNDSDSWSYLLADPDGAVSEFDSDEHAGGGDYEDDDYDDVDLSKAGPALAQLGALMRDGSMLKKMQEVQTRLSASAPPEIREAEQRIKTGRGTAADMQAYQAWARQEMPKHMDEMKSLLGGLLNLPRTGATPPAQKKSQRQRSKAEEAARRERLEPLRQLYAAGVEDDQVNEVLDRKTLYAEDVLAEFLPLLGIADFYANLSYRYLNEITTGELAPRNIQFVHHLKFEMNRPSLRVFS